jgi:hypothetical protein
MEKLCEFLVINIFCTHSSLQDFFRLDINIDNECCIGIKAKASSLQQHNSSALCVRVHVLAAPYTNPHCAARAHDA